MIVPINVPTTVLSILLLQDKININNKMIATIIISWQYLLNQNEFNSLIFVNSASIFLFSISWIVAFSIALLSGYLLIASENKGQTQIDRPDSSRLAPYR